jgi:hypothetical protein
LNPEESIETATEKIETNAALEAMLQIHANRRLLYTLWQETAI